MTTTCNQNDGVFDIINRIIIGTFTSFVLPIVSGFYDLKITHWNFLACKIWQYLVFSMHTGKINRLNFVSTFQLYFV